MPSPPTFTGQVQLPRLVGLTAYRCGLTRGGRSHALEFTSRPPLGIRPGADASGPPHGGPRGWRTSGVPTRTPTGPRPPPAPPPPTPPARPPPPPGPPPPWPAAPLRSSPQAARSPASAGGGAPSRGLTP